jgi:hypothetical protein
MNKALAELEYENVVKFVLNVPQAKAYTVMPNEMYAFIGRGGGKTVGIIAPWILHKMVMMPRSSGGLVGKTFTDIETKILQPLFLAFEQLGYYEYEPSKGGHYVYGKKPPEGWDKPLTPVIDYKHVISFPNGTTLELISLHLKGSANGKSLQWIVCDEAKLLNEVQLRAEVFPILRGHVKHFGSSPWYGAKLFVTDKLSPSMHWLLAKRKLMDKDAINAVIYYQCTINGLRQRLAEDNISNGTVAKILKRIGKIEMVLAGLRKNLVYVVEASAMDNVENLSPDFFDNMRRSLTAYEYAVAIENIDPTRVENSFYPDRKEHHLHTEDYDDDTSKPIGVVLDYQASLSPLVSFQINDRVTGCNSLNFLGDFYVKHPLGLKNVIDQFCDFHKGRICKHVYYFYDHTAVGKRNGQVSFAEEVVQHFENNGWTITYVYMGQAPLQDTKYRRVQFYLQNVQAYPLQVRIHQHRCAIMVLSMDQTGTKETDKGTKKDKSSETDIKFPQEQATHFSDCFDMVIWAVLELNLYPMLTESITTVGFR